MAHPLYQGACPEMHGKACFQPRNLSVWQSRGKRLGIGNSSNPLRPFPHGRILIQDC